MLGIFGREGVFAASEWPLAGDESFIAGGFEMYRNFDGANGAFGDTSIRATTDAVADTSIYASADSADPHRLVLVALNKTASPLTAAFQIAAAGPLAAAQVYQLTGASASPVHAGALAIAGAQSFLYMLPAYSVSTFALTVPEPAGGAAAAFATLLSLSRLRRDRYSSDPRSFASTL